MQAKMTREELEAAIAAFGSIDKLALKIGVHPRTIQKYLYGESNVSNAMATLIRFVMPKQKRK